MAALHSGLRIRDRQRIVVDMSHLHLRSGFVALLATLAPSSASAEPHARHSPPTLTSLTAPEKPLALGTPVTVQLTITDDDPADTHTCTYTWDDGTTETIAAANHACVVSHTYNLPGVYTVGIVVSDGRNTELAEVFVTVYNASGGFVTGEGTIEWPTDLAYTPNPKLTGTARFRFEARFEKNDMTGLAGETSFEIPSAEVEFQSTHYSELVVTAHKAQCRGEGTLNGRDSYGFLLTVHDGDAAGGGGTDRLRMKIWSNTGRVVYDNRPGVSEDIDDAGPTPIASGSVVIH
jgi:hypothetical protein